MMISELCMLACGPSQMLIASLVMSGVGTAMSYIGQAQAASRREAYQDHLAKMQKEAGDRKSAALIAKNIQTGEAVARKRQQVSQQASQASSQAALSAIEGGISGMSVSYMMENFKAQEGAYQYALKEEHRLRGIELERQVEDVTLSTGQQMFATQAPVNYPSALASVLSFGAVAAERGYSYYKYKEGAKEPRKIAGVPWSPAPFTGPTDI